MKHENTLRRFNVLVNEDQRLDLNMEGLRVKIYSLFNLPSTANFSLTYRDEDDDLVTLVDDEDLYDVVRQGLNPVRITVDLKTEKTDQTYTTSSASSTPRGSSSQIPHQNVNPNVAEVLKSVPEPMRHALSKISAELTSKAASTSPILADLLDGFSKMGQSYLNASPSDCGPVNASSNAEGCDDRKQNTPNGKGDASIGEEVKHSNVQKSSSVQQSLKSSQATREAEPIKSSSFPFCPQKGQNGNAEPSSHKFLTSESTKKNTEVIENSVGKSSAYGSTIKCSRGSFKKRVSSEKETSKSNLGDNRRFYLDGSSSNPYFGSNSIGECPFSGLVVPNGRKILRQHANLLDHIPPVLPINDSFSNGMGSIFHKGVRCDGCGVLPITGPRFKSRVKHDYDLCSICFERMGNYVDYSRIDIPLPYRHPPVFKSFYDPIVRVPPVQVPSTMRRPDGKLLRSRLDSRFIMDVNVLDGTMMAPLTRFTKIWRIRNTGTLPWHRGLRLLWIGGDRFSASDSVDIEIPIDGVNVGKEIDIAVDFIAPELPGRYISYWRMAEPPGHKFGQRVWVLIQVDASMDLTCENSPVLDLNLPLDTTEALGTQVLDVNEPELNIVKGDLGSLSMAEQRLLEIEDLNFPINNDLLVASDVLSPTSAAASSSAAPAISANDGVFPEASPVPNPDAAAILEQESPSAPPATLYPVIDMSNGSSATPSITKNDENNLEQDYDRNDVEDTLLKELEEMGFKQVDLNIEVLRTNEYDLERSVDELCGVAEWDPILEELKEMGFEDKETNKKLLAKNNGSITRVVMDLIAGEKSQ